MKKKLYILSAVLIIGLAACKSAIIRQYAVKEPQVETIESVREALIRYSPVYTEYLCVFRDSAALVDWFKNKNLPGRSQFYNSAGYRIITQDSTFCSGIETDFAGKLKISQAYRIDSLTTFEKLRKNLLPLGENVDLDPSKYAFTCVIFWAKFMGKINSPGIQIANSAMQSEPAKIGRVNILFVNMDILDFWNASGNMIKTETRAR
ncbi:MAG: hypothetical protein NTY96_12645 [Bacteroidetes bacterium]|nr:hypothetical protein [Bacteroidota bacterium]